MKRIYSILFVTLSTIAIQLSFHSQLKASAAHAPVIADKEALFKKLCDLIDQNEHDQLDIIFFNDNAVFEEMKNYVSNKNNTLLLFAVQKHRNTFVKKMINKGGESVMNFFVDKNDANKNQIIHKGVVPEAILAQNLKAIEFLILKKVKVENPPYSTIASLFLNRNKGKEIFTILKKYEDEQLAQNNTAANETPKAKNNTLHNSFAAIPLKKRVQKSRQQKKDKSNSADQNKKDKETADPTSQPISASAGAAAASATLQTTIQTEQVVVLAASNIASPDQPQKPPTVQNPIDIWITKLQSANAEYETLLNPKGNIKRGLHISVIQKLRDEYHEIFKAFNRYKYTEKVEKGQTRSYTKYVRLEKALSKLKNK